LTLNENTGFCELRLSSTSPAKAETEQGEEPASIDRRRTILKGLAGLGVVAAGAVGLSALGGRATAAIQDATFLVQDPSADLNAEKVLGTNLTLSGWDYIVWMNGTTVFGQNGRTSKIEFSGADWAAIVNSIIGTVGAETIFVHPDVSASTTTINVNKSNVTIYCPKDNAKNDAGPRTRKIVIGGNASANVRNTTLWGLQVDELQIDAPSTSFDVDGWTVAHCQMNAYATPGQQGLRFTGSGDIENGLFLLCEIRAQNNAVSLVTWEATNDSNGNIAFYRCQLENVSGFTDVNSIKYSATGPGHTGNVVTFTDCSFVHIGGTPSGCSIVRMSGTTVDAGPRKLVLTNPRFEIHQADMNLFPIEIATGLVYYGVFVLNPSIVVGLKTYTWIQNSNSSNFHKGSTLQIRGGHLTGVDPTSFAIGLANGSANFKVKVADVVRFNPLGAATITAGPSPFAYTNDDSVAELVLLDGARGGAGTLLVTKDSITIYSIGNSEKFHLAVWLEPREAITITYTSGTGDSLTLTKSRK